MKKSLAMALVAAMSATAVTAAAPSTEQPRQEKKICKTERVTGSRTRVQRICMTEEEWRLLAASTRKGMDEMGQRAANGSGQNGGTPGG